MTLKTQNFKESDVLCKNFWGNILVNFSKNFCQNFSDFGKKSSDFTRFWQNKKKKNPHNGKFWSVAPVKHFFFNLLIIYLFFVA